MIIIHIFIDLCRNINFGKSPAVYHMPYFVNMRQADLNRSKARIMEGLTAYDIPPTAYLLPLTASNTAER